MRNNYPVVSQELNDKLLLLYEHLVYLLGVKLENKDMVEGLYHRLDEIIEDIVISGTTPPYESSVLPCKYEHYNDCFDKIIAIMKYDYITKKNRGIL